MKYICAQPATRYYAWQLEVMLMNFKEMEVPLQDVHIVCTMPNNLDAARFGHLMKAYPEVTFAFYPDTRRTVFYPSSIRPNLLKQHFFRNKIDAFFYHDCDIVFTKPLNFQDFLEDDICYGSNTRFYIGHDYIKSKGHHILEKMAAIANIPVDTIRENELNCIGAQYLIKGVDHNFWAAIEVICEKLFHDITMLNAEIRMEYPTYTREFELQIWTADMWAVLWQLWKQGKKTMVHDYFDFSMATNVIEDWNRLNIFHNAGVTETGHGFFFKGDYISRPPDKNLQIREKSAQKHYYEYVKRLEHTIW